ncbi:MAG: glycosyltransferase [Streptococcus salivarius]
MGSLPELVGQDKPRKPFSMITASRLAQEKHIDWLVRAVIEFIRPCQISLLISTVVVVWSKLREIIVEAQAGDYIRLMGHADLTDIYSQYEVYLTASTSEGFGLTLMEAVGSGLPMIGFDVPYGNQTFIQDGANGYLSLSLKITSWMLSPSPIRMPLYVSMKKVISKPCVKNLMNLPKAS